MSKQTIGIGTVANDGTGDPLRTAFSKVNLNFTELYSNPFYTATGSKFWAPVNNHPSGGGGTAPGANSIRLFLGYIHATVTISTLNTRVSTLSAGGLAQLAIYAASSSTGMPTGNALVSTASLSTTSTGAIGGAASVQLTPGWYWWASNCDNGTAAFNGWATSSTTITQIVGAYSIVDAVNLVGLSVAQTFGTWPDLTATSWSASNEVTGNSVPAIFFQFASVP